MSETCDSQLEEKQCYRKGCGRKYIEKENGDDACQYHPGFPVFHDALKGWSCCKKRSTDFTEFLNIPGCAKGCHSNIKPPEPEKPCGNDTEVKEILEVEPAPVPKASVPKPRPSESEEMIRLPVSVAATLKSALEKQLNEMTLQNDSEVSDLKNEVSKGTCCKNNACKKSYEDESSNQETCIYHPGVPIFHEGMKYWSCCQRKTSEFDNFLAQEGCAEGKHTWIKKQESSQQVACRYDWHQTAALVIISIFSKVANPERSWVEANQVALRTNIVFGGGKSLFENSMVLAGIIDPKRSSVKMMGAKVEITLRKAEPGSWKTLELRLEQQSTT